MGGSFSSAQQKEFQELNPTQQREYVSEHIHNIAMEYHHTIGKIKNNFYLFVDGEWGPCAHFMEQKKTEWQALNNTVPSEFANFKPPVFCRLQFFCATILYEEDETYKRLDWSFPWCIFKSDPEHAGYMKYDDGNIDDYITSLILAKMFEIWVFLLHLAKRIFAWGTYVDMINPWNFFYNLQFHDENAFQTMINRYQTRFKQVMLNCGCHETIDSHGSRLTCTNANQFNESQKPQRRFQNLAHLWKEASLEEVSDTEKSGVKNKCMLKWYYQVEQMNKLSGFLSESGYLSSDFETKCKTITEGESMAAYCQKDVQLMIDLFENFSAQRFRQKDFNEKNFPQIYDDMFVKGLFGQSKFKWKGAVAERRVLFLDDMKKSDIEFYGKVSPLKKPESKGKKDLKKDSKKDESDEAKRDEKKKGKRSKDEYFVADRKKIQREQIDLANIYCVDITKLFPPLHQTTATPSEQLSDAYCKHVL